MNCNRIVLIALLLWALAMIVPELLRVVHPFGSFGFYANNDGLSYDVTGPFANEASSPAWKAGLRTGVRVDLAHVRCSLSDATWCGRALAAIGGLQFVKPAVDVAATDVLPARQITLVAEARPSVCLSAACSFSTRLPGSRSSWQRLGLCGHGPRQ